MLKRAKLASFSLDKRTGLYYLKNRMHPDLRYEDGSEERILRIIEQTTELSPDGIGVLHKGLGNKIPSFQS